MKILITSGDPKGIGPEVIIKAIKKLDHIKRKDIILIGELSSFKKAGWNSNTVKLIPLAFVDEKKMDDYTAGLISFKAIQLALKLIRSKKSNGIVTGPISKKNWDIAGIKYKGHTEYFRSIFKKDLLMCFSKRHINTALLTEHIPLKDVSKHITRDAIISKAMMFRDMIKIKEKRINILFAGLNPHCGDGGVIGREEIKEIIPAINYLKKYMEVSGPFNPSDIFKNYEKLNATGAFFFYHDQLLSLIKMIDKKNDVVHITWGLDFVRTSPAHGTAFDIAGKNIADETSMLKAIEMAFDLLEKKG